jgi:hypothetical protein
MRRGGGVACLGGRVGLGVVGVVGWAFYGLWFCLFFFIEGCCGYVTMYGVCMLTPLIIHEFVSLLYITLLTICCPVKLLVWFGFKLKRSSFKLQASVTCAHFPFYFLHWEMMSMQRPVLCFYLLSGYDRLAKHVILVKYFFNG